MARASRAAALWIAALFLCGCGTVANLSIGARQGWQNALVYGGVRRDVQSAGQWIDHNWTWGENLDVQQDVGTVVGVGLVGIDLPLSALGDTLTLPLTIPATLWGRSRTATTVSGKKTATAPAAIEPSNPGPLPPYLSAETTPALTEPRQTPAKSIFAGTASWFRSLFSPLYRGESTR
jgi:uncharacterized protein YceK